MIYTWFSIILMLTSNDLLNAEKECPAQEMDALEGFLPLLESL